MCAWSMRIVTCRKFSFPHENCSGGCVIVACALFSYQIRGRNFTSERGTIHSHHIRGPETEGLLMRFTRRHVPLC